jgi:hypothetical protein
MAFQLSDRAKELIPKARIVGLLPLQARLGDDLIAQLQAADDEGRYLTDDELAALGTVAPGLGGAEARFLRDNAAEIVTAARQQVLGHYPGIAEPGGALYPQVRAEACWRDFWHFLRCITYGMACGSDEFTSPEGLHYMNLLYQEMKVPLPAMVTGLEALKQESLARLPEQGEAVAVYFDHLIGQMRVGFGLVWFGGGDRGLDFCLQSQEPGFGLLGVFTNCDLHERLRIAARLGMNASWK